MHAGNGVKKVIVGQNGFMATPAMSALIRGRGLYGGLIMSASHNPAGPNEDWGIKFNYSSGEPAPDKITNEIFKYTETVSELKMADIPDVDLSAVGTSSFGDFEVEVVDCTEDYFKLLQQVRPSGHGLRAGPRTTSSSCSTCAPLATGHLSRRNSTGPVVVRLRRTPPCAFAKTKTNQVSKTRPAHTRDLSSAGVRL